MMTFVQPGPIRDDYAGPGGWSEGLGMLGLTDVGIEWDADACATRIAAGHATIRADLATYRTTSPLWGYIASPPCQTFSVAGSGEGRKLIAKLVKIVHDGDWTQADHMDKRTRHVIDVARNCDEIGAEWICLEQVPSVLPIWQAIAHRLRARGYSVWCGVVNSANYGVPQTRKRAVLIASRKRSVTIPPATHARHPRPDLFSGPLLPWISMATALEWTDNRVDRRLRHSFGEPAPGSWTDHRADPARPAPTIETKARGWCWESPATTVAGDPRITARCHHEAGSQGADAKSTDQVRAGDYAGTEPVRLELVEALVLQSFPADHPVRGSRTAQFRQVGNAIPPLLARACVSMASGVAAE